MLWLTLAVGWVAVAAGPEPSGPPAADRALTRVARLASLSGRGLFTDGKPASETAEYLVESAPRATLVFMLPAGPRTVRAIEILPSPATPKAWASARLRLTWEDDDPEPSRAAVDLPLGLAFGRAPGLPVMESLPVGTSGEAWVNRFPMPYRTQALLRIDTHAPLDGKIRVVTTRGVVSDAGYFKAALRSGPERLSESGRGQLAGLILLSKGPGPPTTSRLMVDGAPATSLGGTLGTDALRPGMSELRGLLLAGPERSAAYCWRVADPIAFQKSFSVDTGADEAAGAPTAVVFWYSENPGPVRVVRAPRELD